MDNHEILTMAMYFIENSVVSRTADMYGIGTYRASRNGHSVSAFQKDGIVSAYVDIVHVRDSDTAKKILVALHDQWMRAAETDEQRLAKFKKMTDAIAKSPGVVTDGRAKEPGRERDRERERI
jgi:hypothetical protein